MIVTHESGAAEFVTQSDHAHNAGEILSLFRLPQLVEHPRRDRLLRAVREHDNGWQEIDAAPALDARTGGPLGFRDVSDAQRREIWTRGSERWRTDDPYVALLINSHAIQLHLDRSGDAAWDGWLDERRQFNIFPHAGQW